jgi:anthranilate phosphoribosyltransferase
MLQAAIQRVEAGESLSSEAMFAAVAAIFAGECSDDQIAALLTALARKGETVDEIVGAARALRQSMTPIRSSRTQLLDTCGTGGDGSQTFNISTAAALVTAAAGVAVAKHGNRRVTSRSGSADVLTELGVNITADLARVEACLDELGICFCFAPLAHPSMKRVAQVRSQLGIRTIFNLLGPLSNPAGARFQLLGVAEQKLRPLLAEALGRLGTERALVVCGDDHLDEVTLSGATQVSEPGPAGVTSRTWQPADFGFEPRPLDELRADGPTASAAIIRQVLAGTPGTARDIVVVNAAAALYTAQPGASLVECVALARKAIDSGAARELLARLAEFSHQ